MFSLVLIETNDLDPQLVPSWSGDFPKDEEDREGKTKGKRGAR